MVSFMLELLYSWYSLDRRLGGNQNGSGYGVKSKHPAPAGN